MSNKEAFSFSKRLKSFIYAFNGIKTFIKTEHNSWIHLVAAIATILIGKIFKINRYDWCLLTIAIGMVLAAEVFNTAIELLTDIVSPGYNEKAKSVKDMAAGAVLIASFVAFIIGIIVFVPYLKF
jgi:diacylglycerol kinase (ATP)